MKPSPAKLNSHNYEKSTSLQALENMKKASNFSEISNNQGSHSSPSLLTRNIDRIMDLEQKDIKEASFLFHSLLKAMNISKIGEDPNREKIINNLLKCSNRFSLYFLEQNKKTESEEILVFSLQILNEFAESQSSSKSLFLHKLFIFNNNACLRTCIGDLDKSKKQLKSLLQEQNISEIHFTIITNNLASIYLKKREFLKAYKSSESGLFKLEPIIFKQMKDANGQGKNFIKDLIVLLQGYLNYARCLIYLQSSPESITDNNLKSQIMAKNPKTFYRNGQKLSFKYLGQECYLAKKFSAYLSMNQKNNTVRIETFHDEMPLDFNMKSNNPSEIHKKNFQINEISESLTQEDSFDKTFDNPKKNFIIKNKTHHRNYKSQMEFGKTNEINRYNEKDYYETMDKMREMEENLRRIQNLREKYKYEKQLIETDYHYIKTKSLEYFNPQNRMQSPNFNNWVMPPPSNFINPQNISVPQNFENINNNNYWQHQFSLMDPMNQNNLPNSNMNNINMANYNSLSTSPNHFFQNPPSTDTNRNLDSEEKNNDFEKLLITLKNDKERIIKESQEKDKEIQRLKENLIKKEKERPIVKNLNQSSNSLFNDETQNNPETLNYHKKSNSTFTKSINKTANPTPSNTPIQPTTKELKQSSNLQKPKLNMDSSSVVKVDQDKTRAISFSGPLSLNEKTKEIQKKEAPLIDKPITSLKHLPDNNPLSKKTAFLKSESNKTLVKLISLMEKKGSIKNIKTENFRRTSIIDTIPKINTPFEVFKSLAVPKFSVVKKKVIVENELFLFEFRTLLNDNKDEVYWIEGYNLETAKAMKTAILKEDILKKVLDSINFEDIIPLTHPLNSISQYLDFVKYFIMPFIGIGKNTEQNLTKKYDYKMEIWPRAPGLFNQSFTRSFLGEECLMFLHHTINNNFRLVLTNDIKGPSIRCEMTFDLEIMKKYFPYVDNNYGKHDEMHDLITIVENMRDQEKSNENEQIEQIQQIISKYDHDQEDSNQKEYFLESFKKTYHQEILTFLNKFIEQFELFLVSLDLKNYKDITESEVFMFFKVNAWSEFSKFRMSSIIENFEKKGLGIYMKNGFESNGPNNSKIQVEGRKIHMFESVLKTFGLEWQKLEKNEKRIISYFTLDNYKLEVYEKEVPVDIKFDFNPIIYVPLDCGGHFRTFVGDNYKIPLTLSYIGIGELPFGVKVTVFDHINCIETGIFYTINEKLWRKKNKENDKAKKKKKYILDNELDEKYNINTVLKTIGYVLLMDSVRIRENNLKVTLEGRVTFNRSGKISQLESALSINNIINSYQKNNFSK